MTADKKNFIFIFSFNFFLSVSLIYFTIDPSQLNSENTNDASPARSNASQENSEKIVKQLKPVTKPGLPTTKQLVKMSALPVSPYAKKYSKEIFEQKFSNWGIDPKLKSSINLVKAWQIYKKKKDIVVAVIDTGIAPNHSYLKKNIFVKNKKVSKSNFGVDFSQSKPSLTPIDTHGHGTHVSGIIKSIFPEVKILSLKYYNPKASGLVNLNSTIQALKYAVDQGVDVINYSGGGPEPSSEEYQILRKALQKKILVIAAAGNENSNIDSPSKAYYPASYGLPNIITVAAYNKNLNLIASSNWGARSVDVAAPGNKIGSSIHTGGKAAMTGTSQATAFVTGIAALMLSNDPKLNPLEIKNILVSSSIDTKNLYKTVKKFDPVKKVYKLAPEKALAGGKVDAYLALKQASSSIKKPNLPNVKPTSPKAKRDVAQKKTKLKK
ncbi:S8 family serine peptidase [Bacteriovoracaceae bacterium]|nr:S8 family serine peptidase [Bacteriovoracaceae bacterium]